MTTYDIGNWLNTASFFMIAGTGASISMKCGEFNLGGEGQIYAGGFVCAVILAKAANLGVGIALPLALLAAILTSSVLCFFSALLHKYRNASFLLTSFIISSAIIPLINGLIAGPCRGSTGNLLATPFISQKFRFLRILKPSSLNVSFFIAVLICLAGAFILFKTNFGRKLCIYGISNEFAKYSGFSEKTIIFSSSLISGGLHGLCGAFIICGTYYTCHSGFYTGLGWSGLSASMIAGSNPLFVIVSSLFLAAVSSFTSIFSLHHNVGFDLGAIIQACIMFVVSIPFILKLKRGNS